MATTKTTSDTTCTLTELKNRSLSVPDVRLAITPPTGAPIEIALGLRPLVLGKDPSCDVVVPDRGVTGRHCELALTSRGIVVKDLKSKNGTFIGDVQITEGILGVG